MKNSLRNARKHPDNCPICGQYVCPHYQASDTPSTDPKSPRYHKCDPDFLKRSEASTNGQLKRDPDEDEPRRRPIGQRLAEGFEMLSEDDPPDHDWDLTTGD